MMLIMRHFKRQHKNGGWALGREHWQHLHFTRSFGHGNVYGNHFDFIKAGLRCPNGPLPITKQ